MGQNGKGLEGHMPARARSLPQEHGHVFLGNPRGCWLRLHRDEGPRLWCRLAHDDCPMPTFIPLKLNLRMRVQK